MNASIHELLGLINIDQDISIGHNLIDELLSPELEQEIFDGANSLLTARGETLEDFTQRDVENARGNNNFHYIISSVGDDEIVTTDSYLLSPLLFSAGAKLSKIEISMPDTGFSKEIGNYAEGYILMPRTAECSFDAINRRHRSTGVPYVLDPVKLKQLSAVRKQSRFDSDLESKYARLYDTVSWVDQDWFTYPYHQMSLVVSLAVFDYKNALNFPFLFKSEGGCGGFPPFMNPDTVRCALFHFNRGKATETITNIMAECVSIFNGTLKPENNLFLRATHLAQMGSKQYEDFLTSYQFLKSLREDERKDFLSQMHEEIMQVPTELDQFGAVINSKDYLLGETISQLRSDGLLMTNLDVKINLANQIKISGLFKDKPYAQTLLELEEQEALIRRAPWRDIPKIPGIEKVSVNTLPNIRELISEYLRTHKSRPFLSSFSYQDEFKVFPANKVRDYFLKINKNLRDEVIANLPIERQLKRSFKNERKALQLSKAEEWINSAPLAELLQSPIPPGIGPDDSRIMREIISVLHRTGDKPNITNVLLVITDDRRLSQDISTILHRMFEDQRWILARLSTKAYFTACIRNPRPGSAFPIYNWKERRETSFPLIRDMILNHAHATQNYLLSTFFDVQNIERNYEQITFDRSGLLRYKIRGYLSRAELHERNRYGWADMPHSELCSLPCWNIEHTIVRRYNYELNATTLEVYSNDLPRRWR